MLINFELTNLTLSRIVKIKYKYQLSIMSYPKSTRLFFALALLILIRSSFQTNILDFQYTQYTQALTTKHHHNQDFDFNPIPIPQEKLKFPQACDIVDTINEPLKQKQNHFINNDIDCYLNDIKAKFMRLLTLNQKLANTQEKILHFQALINQTNPVPPKETQIMQLQKFEAKLKNLTETITILDQQLQANLSQIDSINNEYHVNQAKRTELDYKIDWLKQKINYLNNFENKARLAKERSGSQTDYDKYFSDLNKLYQKEEEMISQIDLIIQKKDSLTVLRNQRDILHASVAALELYISDIEECNTQKQKIRKEFKNHEKINQLIHQLKLLKKNQEPNIYCEGVVKKLTEKIKTMVKYYAIVASCASDLDHKLEDLKREKDKLEKVKEKIAQFQGIDNMEDFEKEFSQQKEQVRKMKLKIKDWKIKQFIHDPEKLSEFRKNAQADLLLAMKQKSTITQATSCRPVKQRQTVSKNIIDLVKEIRSIKYSYCGTYHKYDSLANILWSETYRFESQTQFKNSLWETYKNQRIEYQNMYKEMLNLRDEIQRSLG